MYEDCRVYGPYDRKEDNRQHVIIISLDGKRKTLSYPRYVMEINLNRYLTKDEEVHHIDGNEKNNTIFNLVIIPTHVHKRMKRGSKFNELAKEIHTCPMCKIEFKLTLEQTRERYYNEERKMIHGPFCSGECVGNFGRTIQKIYQKL